MLRRRKSLDFRAPNGATTVTLNLTGRLNWRDNSGKKKLYQIYIWLIRYHPFSLNTFQII
jgi:hypothetical protein